MNGHSTLSRPRHLTEPSARKPTGSQGDHITLEPKNIRTPAHTLHQHSPGRRSIRSSPPNRESPTGGTNPTHKNQLQKIPADVRRPPSPNLHRPTQHHKLRAAHRFPAERRIPTPAGNPASASPRRPEHPTPNRRKPLRSPPPLTRQAERAFPQPATGNVISPDPRPGRPAPPLPPPHAPTGHPLPQRSALSMKGYPHPPDPWSWLSSRETVGRASKPSSHPPRPGATHNLRPPPPSSKGGTTRPTVKPHPNQH